MEPTPYDVDEETHNARYIAAVKAGQPALRMYWEEEFRRSGLREGYRRALADMKEINDNQN